VHDAILRDSEIEEDGDGQTNKVRFRDSKVGVAIVDARTHKATAFYRYCPTALLFGTWDSTAGEGADSAKIPRAVVSEIIGVDVTAGVRTASRIDPLGIKAQSATIYRRKDGGWALQDDNGVWIGAQQEDIDSENGEFKKFGKGKPSDINHGNVTPDLPRFDRKEIQNHKLDRLTNILESSPLKLRFDIDSSDSRIESHTAVDSERVRIRAGAVKPGGVTAAYALHTWTLSLTQLRRLRFPVSEKHDTEAVDLAARTVLAALAIYALALQHERGFWLRSRCELTPQAEQCGAVVLEHVKTDGTSVTLRLPSAAEAKVLLTSALAEAGRVAPSISWGRTVLRLTPTEQLRKLVDLSDGRESALEDEEPAVADDAGDQG
jgi:CRISPR-associated protein Csb1